MSQFLQTTEQVCLDRSLGTSENRADLFRGEPFQMSQNHHGPLERGEFMKCTFQVFAHIPGVERRFVVVSGFGDVNGSEPHAVTALCFAGRG